MSNLRDDRLAELIVWLVVFETKLMALIAKLYVYLLNMFFGSGIREKRLRQEYLLFRFTLNLKADESSKNDVVVLRFEHARQNLLVF